MARTAGPGAAARNGLLHLHHPQIRRPRSSAIAANREGRLMGKTALGEIGGLRSATPLLH